MDSLETLSPIQGRAVQSTEGYVRLIASAGTGKTRVLTHRFAWLVEELGILPENILCVTFTNKSAAEMRQRIHTLCGDQDTGLITTFHGLANQILNEEADALSYPDTFLVLDNRDIDMMLERIYEERSLSLRHMSFAKARDKIEIFKLSEYPDYYLDLISLSLSELREAYLKATRMEDIIFRGYLYQQRKCFGLDYNDLIILTLHLFGTRPDIREKWQERLEYIMIDEFQDIDGLQYRLMEALQGYHHNLFVVGDPDQTIYTWRGANVKYLLDFDQNFAPCSTLVLDENFRSTQAILDVCNSLISRNTQRFDKNLWSGGSPGRKVQAAVFETSGKEADWIAAKIREEQQKGTPLEAITILYRAHYMSRSIEDSLLEAGIPYKICSGTAFYERAEIKDALAYLRMLSCRDDLSFQRIVNTPKRGIGKRRMEALEQTAQQRQISLFEALKLLQEDDLFASTQAGKFIDLIEQTQWQDQPVSRVLSKILDDSGYEAMLRTQGAQERLDNLAELKQSVMEFEALCGEETDLNAYLSSVALSSAQDYTGKEGKVKLMSIHTAKGLEFDTVFLCCLCEGMFPARRVRSLAEMEEERRLAFVAMTRAKRRLFLSSGLGRNQDGSARYVSRFLLDIDPDLLEMEQCIEEDQLEDARGYIRASQRSLEFLNASALFACGDEIEHPAFGKGIILEVDEQKHCYRILFEKLATERKITFKAKMKKTGHAGDLHSLN